MKNKQQELTREEQSQVMQSAEEFVRDLNYSELYELALENITNEYLPRNFLDYLRTIVFKNIDFYEISTNDIIQMWNETENKQDFIKLEKQ